MRKDRLHRWINPPVLLLAFASAVPLFAQETLLEFDPAQTRLEFTLNDILHTVHGTFRLKQGSIRFDPATGRAGGLLVVDATSGDSGSGARDRKMHKDILESQNFPEITFLPVRVTGSMAPQGEWQYEVQGLFGLHGSEHELNMTGSVHISGDRFTATAHFVVPYTNWGVKNPSTFILRVSGKVEINISAAGHVTQ
jgi:polyisoprenoid-binding protein YceI